MTVRKYLTALLIGTAGFFSACSACADTILHYTFDDPANFGKNSGTAENADAEAYLLSEMSSVPGAIGKALVCTGMADSLHLENPARFIPGPCTISFFFRPEHMRERMTLVSFYGDDNNILGLDIVNKHLAFNDFRRPKVRQLKQFGPQLELNRFYHVIWRMDGKNVQVYLDGKEVFKQEYTLVPADFKPQRMNIGTDYHNVVAQRYRLVGTLDDLQIDSAAPTAESMVFCMSAAALQGGWWCSPSLKCMESMPRNSAMFSRA